MDIRSVVNKYGVKMTEIAAKMGTSKGYISQLVSGKPEPTLRKLKELADAIGCQRYEFFLDEMPEEVINALNGNDGFNITTPSTPSQKTEEDALPFLSEESDPTKETHAVETQQAIVCPNCGKPMVISVKS